VTILLLPAFFAVTGLRMQVSVLTAPTEWLVLGAVLLVGSLGKVGGTAVAARVAGCTWREALGLGALMNTRGLMQLIVLNIALDLGVFSHALFSVLVLAAIVSTVATAPALHLLGLWRPVHPGRPPAASPAGH
jgi:Kef-type K+ transport system membrane component KefB